MGKRGPKPLDKRERHLMIVRDIANGQENPAIARSLGLSVAMIKKEIAALMTHHGARNRAQLVHEAYRSGLLRVNA